MKFIDNRKSVKVNFDEIKNGEIFEYCGVFYLKAVKEDRYNAVNIANGVLDGFNDKIMVTPVKATLTINRLD